jgi:acetyl-CoA C-acetyltransferase
MSREEADRRGLTPLATIVGYAGARPGARVVHHGARRGDRRRSAAPGSRPTTSTCGSSTRPSPWSRWSTRTASASTHERLNTRGGAIALGHPIGCSGARVLTTLLYALKQDGKRRGVASLCIGGGEAVAVVVERCRGRAGG